MGSMSFNEAREKAIDAEVIEVTPVVADVTEGKEVIVRPVSVPQTIYVENEDVQGEFTQRDKVYPSMTLVTKTSALARPFGIGAWVVGKEIKIGEMDKPLRMVAVKIATRWQEELPYNSGVKPRIFKTASEAATAGFDTVDWNAEKVAKEILVAALWLPKPEGIDEPSLFTIDSPEGPGAIVKYFAAKTAFKNFGRTLKEAAHPKTGFLRPEKGGLASQWWELTATEMANNKYSWLEPRLKAMEKTTDVLREFLKDLGV